MTMFGCIYQLWDWLDSPPLFTAATMESKKLQQLQQANLHLAPQKKSASNYQTNLIDHRTSTHSPVFHQQIHHAHQPQQKSTIITSNLGSSGQSITAIDIQPQEKHLIQHNVSSTIGSPPYHQQYTGGEQIYQSPPDRTYQMAISGRAPPSNVVQQSNPVTALQQQYQQLQQAKIQAQIQTQNESLAHQQRTFALRQKMNPPIPQNQYHMSQSSSVMSSVGLMQNQQQLNQSVVTSGPQRIAPPSTLNLSTQFQPASGPLKMGGGATSSSTMVNNHKQQQQQPLYCEQTIYAQQQQQLQLQLQLQQQHLQTQQISGYHAPDSSQLLKHQIKLDIAASTPGVDHSPVYIQQNHPGHVVNQACQTQISGSTMNKVSGSAIAISTPKTPSSEESATKSPTHQGLDRKKSSGSIQALKSPITKRPLSSPVTISGWLYKQGSDGLKVWRKRWFVLAEYILYYYKGPEEEKLLGSILLPSYRVSACLAEDKIYRKFAFKCEHTNMRTYWLAAETAESMIQWVRALSAATMMQATSNSGESDQASQPSVSSSLNHSGENSDSGIHTLQSQQSKMSLNQGPVTPASENGISALTNASASVGGGGGGSSGNTQQPLYANAPPKPRRINDGGYSSPSPEHSSLDNERRAHQQLHLQHQGHYAQQQQQQQQFMSSRHGSGVMSPTLKQMQRSQQHTIYDTRTGNMISTLRLQQNPMDNLDDKFQEQMALCNTIADEYSKSTANMQYMDMEEQIMRLQQQQQQLQKQQQSAPIEDIYGERELYMQKVIQQRYPPNQQMFSYMDTTERRTPDAYGRSKNRPFSDYENIYNLSQMAAGEQQQQQQQESILAAPSTASGYRRPLSPPVYDTSKHVPPMPSKYSQNHLEPSTTSVAEASTSSNSLHARPAASIVRPHSADFLEYKARSEAGMAALSAKSAIKPETIRAPRPKSSLDINRTPDSFYYSEASYAEKMRKSALYLQNPQSQHQQSSSTVSSMPPGSAGTQQQQQQQQLQQPSYSSNHHSDFNSVYGNAGMNTIGYENPYERAYKRNEFLSEAMNNQGASSIPRMSRSAVGGVATSNVPTGALAISHSRSASHHSQLQPQTYSTFQQQRQQQSPAQSSGPQQLQEQFLRSASARLPKRSGCDIDDDIAASSYNNMSPTSPPPPAPSSTTSAISTAMQDGERKREESMKRLLEWKQRMLQSPLTRKGALQHCGSSTSAMAKLGSNPNIQLSSTIESAGSQLAQQQMHRSKNSMSDGLARGIESRGIQRSRSETHANATGYNSYSSDDEASISVRNVNNLPKGNLTVKLDSSDHHRQHLNYDQMAKMTNSYYDIAHDTKYAKTTSLATVEKTNKFNGFYAPNAIIHSTPMQENFGCDLLNGSIYDINATSSANYRESNGFPMRRVGSRAEIDMLERETSTQIRNLDVSAGDLLSRTHEELVLLLIQLRRQNSNTARAIEQCCTDIHEIQNRIRTSEGLTRAESIQRLDYLKQHLLDLERQYEKSKPLVNLVDNMVKLGSLYRNNENTTESVRQRQETATLDRLEFSQKVQERRLLQEEQKQWDRLSPNHSELQSKVRQLYQLDQLLQEESGTLQNLQRDKEDLERALGGLRARIQDTNGPSIALDAAKKQQHILERELSRVHQLLAENSKVDEKLEQTVAGNARLEQELLVLRQKLQASRSNRGSQGVLSSAANEGMQYASNTTAMLESELKRVQQLVGDMQRQRQELSSAVRQLTENSNRLYQEIGNKENSESVASTSSHIKKRNSSTCWIETDLDSMVSIDRTVNDNVPSNLSTPLYVDTGSNNSNSMLSCKTNASGDEHIISSSSSKSHHSRSRHSHNRYNESDGIETSGIDSDGFMETNPFANLASQEKQEIKTVRIVKRESERRHRDRERNVTNSTLNLDQVPEEDNQGQSAANYMTDDFPARSKSLPRQYNEPPKPRTHKYSFNGGSTDTNMILSRLNHQQHNGGHHINHQTGQKFEYYANGSTSSSSNMIPFDKNSNYSSSVPSSTIANHSTNGKDNYYHHNNQQQPQSNNFSKQNHVTPMANAYFGNHHHGPINEMRTSARGINENGLLRKKTDSMQSLSKIITDLSSGQVFQSEAARQIINEMSAGSASEDNGATDKVPPSHKHRRAVPREKRRHYTAPNNVNQKAMENIQAENDMNRNNTNWRARDDLDMEVALRPRINAPDVVRSALGHGEKISENTIDNLLLAPNKIVIPERYIPEKAPELSPEERKRRQEKVEVIKKMLSEAPINTSNDNISLPPSKLNAEKKQREHLLQLNQILAQQVMQMSKIVAEKAMAKQKVSDMNNSSVTSDEGDRSVSPTDSLPLYQQRDNFFT